MRAFVALTLVGLLVSCHGAPSLWYPSTQFIMGCCLHVEAQLSGTMGVGCSS